MEEPFSLPPLPWRGAKPAWTQEEIRREWERILTESDMLFVGAQAALVNALAQQSLIAERCAQQLLALPENDHMGLARTARVSRETGKEISRLLEALGLSDAVARQNASSLQKLKKRLWETETEFNSLRQKYDNLCRERKQVIPLPNPILRA